MVDGWMIVWFSRLMILLMGQRYRSLMPLLLLLLLTTGGSKVRVMSPLSQYVPTFVSSFANCYLVVPRVVLALDTKVQQKKRMKVC